MSTILQLTMSVFSIDILYTYIEVGTLDAHKFNVTDGKTLSPYTKYPINPKLEYKITTTHIPEYITLLA